MGFSNIEQKDWFYNFLKKNVEFTHNKIFYRKVYVINSGKIPKNSHIIITPNHQNALMDALALLCNVDQQVVFMARSDIFRKKFSATILYFLKILPIFRIRDGYSSLKKNQDIFQKTIDVLNAGNGLFIHPEGNHEGKRALRPFKKGFARIAFQTEEANDFKLDIKIIPVGLHYSDYIKARSDLYITFGDPISVSDYYTLYQENTAVAMNRLKTDLADKIKPLMVNIENGDQYDIYDSLRLYYWEKVSVNPKKENRVKAEQQVIQEVEKIEKQKPELFNRLAKQVISYRNLLSKYKISDEVIKKPSGTSMLLLKFIMYLLGFPFLVYSLIVNLIPTLIVKYVVGKIQDPQFKSSVKYVLSLVIFPVFYLIQAIIALLVISQKWIGLAFLFSLPLAGIYAYFYFHSFRGFLLQSRLWFLKLTKRKEIKKILSAKTEMDQLISDFIR